MRLTAAEYLAWEAAQPSQHELLRGEVRARLAESPRHYALSVGTTIAINGALCGRRYTGLMADRQIAIEGAHYVYPDVGAVLGPLQLQEGTHDVITNPSLIVEILSQVTERYDRGVKWSCYQQLPSLTDYLLVSQAKVQIEHYRRTVGGAWIYRSYASGERIELTADAALPVDAIFAGAFSLPGD